MTEYPKVSVVTITYGHENYITQTMEGVLMQDYPGQIEFIIANDHSPDSTDCVIKDYLAMNKIPSNFTIKYTQHEINKGMMPNFIWALEQASGKYIALCEGDDYWTDHLKLKKQVSFLLKNIEVVLCFHAAKRYIEITGDISVNIPLETRQYTGEEFLRTWLVATASVLFIRDCFDAEIKDRLLYPNYIFGDIILFLSVAQKGQTYCLNEVMSVYRVHEGSMMRVLGQDIHRTSRYINHHKQMAKDFSGRYSTINYLIIAETYYYNFIREKQKSIRINYFFKYNFFLLRHSKKYFFSKNNIKTFVYHIFYKPFYF